MVRCVEAEANGIQQHGERRIVVHRDGIEHLLHEGDLLPFARPAMTGQCPQTVREHERYARCIRLNRQWNRPAMKENDWPRYTSKQIEKTAELLEANVAQRRSRRCGADISRVHDERRSVLI